jgi:hypothetical protein
MSYWWKIRLEKIAKAERLKKKNEEILEHNRRVRAMPDFCENCKETCMVKIGVAFGNDIKYDRYKCPNCGKIKDVPVGA